jgi:hypothetical protein
VFFPLRSIALVKIFIGRNSMTFQFSKTLETLDILMEIIVLLQIIAISGEV